jgi:transcriptional regulator with XRE-family HTH domain
VPELQESSKLLKTVGANIRRLRMRKNITQQTLSERADLDIRTVQRVEAGKIDVLFRTLNSIRLALRCDWKDIIGHR